MTKNGKEPKEAKEVKDVDAEQMSLFNGNNTNADIKANTKSINQVTKGEMLEYQIKRLFFFMGYYTKNNIIIQTSQEEPYDVITDLDVYGTYIHTDFAEKTIWADCKSGNAQELSRISWLIGIKDLINVDDILFVKKGTKTSTKTFANSKGIKIVDLGIISDMEKRYNISKSDWRNAWNPDVQIINSETFKNINIPDNFMCKRIHKFITTHYWANTDDFTRAKKTITALRDLSSIVELPLQNNQIVAAKWAVYQLIGMLTLAVLRICQKIFYLPDKDKVDHIVNGLIYGSNSRTKIDEILKVTNAIARKTLYKYTIDDKISQDLPEIKLNPPEYTEAFIDLILRITNSPLQYYDILRFLDYTLLQYDLNGTEYNDKELSNIFKNQDTLLTSSKTILHFVCYITKVPRGIFVLLKDR